MGVYLLFSAILIILVCATLMGHGSSNKNTPEIILGICLSFVFVVLFKEALSEYHEPKAIEVYQGRTVLEYTIRNDVVVDSAVVYEDENK